MGNMGSQVVVARKDFSKWLEYPESRQTKSNASAVGHIVYPFTTYMCKSKVAQSPR